MRLLRISWANSPARRYLLRPTIADMAAVEPSCCRSPSRLKVFRRPPIQFPLVRLSVRRRRPRFCRPHFCERINRGFGVVCGEEDGIAGRETILVDRRPPSSGRLRHVHLCRTRRPPPRLFQPRLTYVPSASDATCRGAAVCQFPLTGFFRPMPMLVGDVQENIESAAAGGRMRVGIVCRIPEVGQAGGHVDRGSGIHLLIRALRERTRLLSRIPFAALPTRSEGCSIGSLSLPDQPSAMPSRCCVHVVPLHYRGPYFRHAIPAWPDRPCRPCPGRNVHGLLFGSLCKLTIPRLGFSPVRSMSVRATRHCPVSPPFP
jgi:hypothetical protein